MVETPAPWVLLVDHSTLLPGARAALEPECEVRAADSVEEALRLLHAAPFDLAVLDAHLAFSHGARLLEQVHARLPCLLLWFTTPATLEADVAFLERWGLPVLLKPYRGDELMTAVRRVLSERC